MEQVAADAEFLSQLVDGLAGGQEFECLGFELGGAALSGFGFHLLLISSGRWSRNLAHPTIQDLQSSIPPLIPVAPKNRGGPPVTVQI